MLINGEKLSDKASKSIFFSSSSFFDNFLNLDSKEAFMEKVLYVLAWGFGYDKMFRIPHP